jgi:DNA-binding MarR family transcriptional regulator
MSEVFSDGIYHKFMHMAKLTAMKTHEKLDSIGLYRGQPVLLFNLWEKNGLSGRELSGLMEVQPATVTKMVQRLKNNGYVYTVSDAEDSRVSRVYLTDKGVDIEGAVRAIFDELHHSVFAGLSQEKLDLLEDVLDTMRTNINKMI